MINKLWQDTQQAVADIGDGAVVGIGGFGGAGVPHDLIDALIEKAPKDLTLITNNAGSGETGIAALLNAGLVRKIVCSYPRMAGSHVFEGLYRRGRIELEVTPQGNMAERLRAAGAGIAGFYTRTGYGTLLAQDRETREFEGKHYVLERPIPLDFALIKAESGDRWGNLVYRKTSRNFGPVMATAARCAIASIGRLAELGELDPEAVVTPGIYVKRMVLRPN
jgi:3-oxoadipate CoA-transferase alpha subunit